MSLTRSEVIRTPARYRAARSDRSRRSRAEPAGTTATGAGRAAGRGAELHGWVHSDQEGAQAAMTERKPAGMSFRSWIDEQIDRATAQGAFDDLPGAGKPLPPRTDFDGLT